MTLPYYLAIRRYLVPLADREAGPQPHRHDYPTADEYAAAFHLWRAIHRDAELTDPERDAQLHAMLDFAGIRFWCDWCHDFFPPRYASIGGVAQIGPYHGAGGIFGNHGLRRVEVGVVPFGDRQFATWMRDAYSGRYL